MRYAKYGTLAGLAACAAVAVGVLGVGGERPATAADEVRAAWAKAKAVKSVRAVTTLIAMTEERDIVDWTSFFTSDAIRIEQRHIDSVPVTIYDFRERVELELDPRKRTARTKGLSPREVMKLRGALADVADPLGNADRLKRAKVRFLRTDELLGKAADAYQIDDPGQPGGPDDVPVPASTETIWLDKTTRLPARSVAIVPKDGQVRINVFEAWGEAFDPKLFSLKIPTGYKEVD